ncbi:hypothetical protein [Geobacter argillaceus]|nr:hypothetical protein [Geobacter argillaceus]
MAEALEGIADANAGRVITTKELLKWLKPWRKNNACIPDGCNRGEH